MRVELDLKTNPLVLEGDIKDIRQITVCLIKQGYLEPEYRFNGGRGALLCSVCKVVLHTGLSLEESKPEVCIGSCFDND